MLTLYNKILQEFLI